MCHKNHVEAVGKKFREMTESNEEFDGPKYYFQAISRKLCQLPQVAQVMKHLGLH